VESELYYVTFEMFVEDVKRMFLNARTYNSPETIYYKCATRHGANLLFIFLHSLTLHIKNVCCLLIFLYSFAG